MWPLLGLRRASYVYGGRPIMLDQFMVSKGFLVEKSNLSIKVDSVSIEIFSEMTKKGKPIRFGRPSRRLNEKGFSDHLPISLKINFKK